MTFQFDTFIGTDYKDINTPATPLVFQAGEMMRNYGGFFHFQGGGGGNG